ncbi:hypothetical protein B0H13DRAFT_54120 [Mycena leptocephala]|nr:hypothetical protein B0H13DRAFT_54120 [Mycena leptocephala]
MLPTKTSSAAALPPAPACDHNSPKARTPPTQNSNPQGYHPHPNQYSARPRRRTTPIPCLPPAAICAPIRRIPKRTSSTEHMGAKPPPTIPAWRLRGRPRPTHGRAGADTHAGRDVPAGGAGASVEALGVACAATVAFASVAAIGPTHAESGYWRRGGAGY